MRLTAYFLKTVSFNVLILSASLESNACGPFLDYIPDHDYFECSVQPREEGKSDVEENLLLWQKLTSKNIPLEHIRKAVYKDSRDTFWKICNQLKNKDGNSFYAYL